QYPSRRSSPRWSLRRSLGHLSHSAEHREKHWEKHWEKYWETSSEALGGPLGGACSIIEIRRLDSENSKWRSHSSPAAFKLSGKLLPFKVAGALGELVAR